MADPVTYLSLFAGAGGLDLALRLALPAARCIGYVEIDLAAVGELDARMADGTLDAAPLWSDIRTFPANLFRGRVAGAIFGFPCQDLSLAGRREGIGSDTRSGLFFDAIGIVRTVGCEWVFMENVPPVLAFPAGATVLGELAQIGFDAEWLSLEAAEVGAAHKRERVFILGYRPGGLDALDLALGA